MECKNCKEFPVKARGLCRKCYNKWWNKKHKKERKIYRRKYYEEHREKEKEYSRQHGKLWDAKNKDKRREYRQKPSYKAKEKKRRLRYLKKSGYRQRKINKFNVVFRKNDKGKYIFRGVCKIRDNKQYVINSEICYPNYEDAFIDAKEIF